MMKSCSTPVSRSPREDSQTKSCEQSKSKQSRKQELQIVAHPYIFQPQGAPDRPDVPEIRHDLTMTPTFAHPFECRRLDRELFVFGESQGIIDLRDQKAPDTIHLLLTISDFGNVVVHASYG